MPDGNQGIIPSLSALKYLVAAAKLSEQCNKPELAGKVMDIVRKVSKIEKAAIRKRINHYVCHMFAEIIGSVPISILKVEDIDLLPTWLDNELHSGATAKKINEGILPRVLNENTSDSLKMACRILYHCTAVKWESEYGMNDKYLRPMTVIEDYWLGEFAQKTYLCLWRKNVERNSKIIHCQTERNL